MSDAACKRIAASIHLLALNATLSQEALMTDALWERTERLRRYLQILVQVLPQVLLNFAQITVELRLN